MRIKIPPNYFVRVFGQIYSEISSLTLLPLKKQISILSFWALVRKRPLGSPFTEKIRHAPPIIFFFA